MKNMLGSIMCFLCCLKSGGSAFKDSHTDAPLTLVYVVGASSLRFRNVQSLPLFKKLHFEHGWQLQVGSLGRECQRSVAECMKFQKVHVF